MKSQTPFNPLLLIGDIVAFVAFAFVGLSSHDKDYSPAAFARTVLPFLLPWLATAWAMGLYRKQPSEPSEILKPVLLAWLPAWAIGLVLRSLVFGRAFSPAFAIVTLVINLALLLSWRSAATMMQKEQPQA